MISPEGKLRYLIVKLRFLSFIQIFSSAQGLMLVFRGHSGDSPNSAFVV